MAGENDDYDDAPPAATSGPYLYSPSDPDTSQEAAEDAVASGLVGGHEALILAELIRCPGQTADEIGAALGLTNVQVLRRTRHMTVPVVREGVEERPAVIRSGCKRTGGVSGRSQVTWWPLATANNGG